MDRRVMVGLGALTVVGAAFLVFSLMRGQGGGGAHDAEDLSAQDALASATAAGPPGTGAAAEGQAGAPTGEQVGAEGAEPGAEGQRQGETGEGEPGAGQRPGAEAAQGTNDETAQAQAPERDPALPAAAGTLTPESIRDTVRENAGFFRFCFEWELNRHPELAGRVAMSFVIAEDGSVREARVLEDGLENETVTRCFEGVTSRMTFPPPDRGEVTVTYPFILDGSPAAQRPDGI